MVELREGETLDSKIVRRLAKQAVALSVQLGNPTDAAQSER